MDSKYIIKSGGKEYIASKYQIDIFKNIEHGSGNMIINASAGSSKTTTIINAIRYISEKKKILFVAFNKDIVDKIKNSVDHNNTTVSTFHSLGFKILQENGIISSQEPSSIDTSNNNIINIYKYNNYINNNINNITRFKETNSLGKKYNQYINNIKQLVNYSRYYQAFTIKEIDKVSKIYDIITIRDEYEICRNVLLWGKSNLQTIDYTDMIWLPNVLNLTTKKYTYDWIFIDEAQDTSIAELQMIDKCFKRGTRFVSIGDNHQQINVWAGASEKAIDILKKRNNTKFFKLPISYRCPKKIVELARKYSDNIEYAEDAIDGEINYDVSVNDPKTNDMVLCRSTAPLIDLFLNYLRINKKAYLKGFENIREDYIDLINYTKSSLIDKNCITTDGLFPKLYTKLLNEISLCSKKYDLNENEILLHPSVINLYDNIEGIKVLSEGLTTVGELIDKINVIFNDNESNNAIQLSTIHKAKGLEADNVFILYPSLLPSKLAKKEWEIQAENNLTYVAYTRAKKTLNFMKEDKYCKLFNGYFNIENMKSFLNEIKVKLNYNNELGVTEKNYDNTVNNCNTVKLGEKKEYKLSITTNTHKKGGLKLKNLL